jgi:hypothetical protein
MLDLGSRLENPEKPPHLAETSSEPQRLIDVSE